jgi:hypothetical protein
MSVTLLLRSSDRKHLRGLLCVLFAAIFAGSTLADTPLPEESNWAWIHTGPLGDKWEAVTGKAKVTVKGATFSAELFHADHPNLVSFRLDGTIKGDKITVRSVRQNSDAGSTVFSGTIKTRSMKGFADLTGKQTILLYDDWDHQIGLTRTLRR